MVLFEIIGTIFDILVGLGVPGWLARMVMWGLLLAAAVVTWRVARAAYPRSAEGRRKK